MDKIYPTQLEDHQITNLMAILNYNDIVYPQKGNDTHPWLQGLVIDEDQWLLVDMQRQIPHVKQEHWLPGVKQASKSDFLIALASSLLFGFASVAEQLVKETARLEQNGSFLVRFSNGIWKPDYIWSGLRMAYENRNILHPTYFWSFKIPNMFGTQTPLYS